MRHADIDSTNHVNSISLTMAQHALFRLLGALLVYMSVCDDAAPHLQFCQSDKKEQAVRVYTRNSTDGVTTRSHAILTNQPYLFPSAAKWPQRLLSPPRRLAYAKRSPHLAINGSQQRRFYLHAPWPHTADIYRYVKPRKSIDQTPPLYPFCNISDPRLAPKNYILVTVALYYTKYTTKYMLVTVALYGVGYKKISFLEYRHSITPLYPI